MSFLRSTMRTAYVPPPPPVDISRVPNQEIIEPVKINTKKKKKEYEIGDDKKEIIDNIISSKPVINDLRKALKRYAEISTEEYYDDEDN